jgi:uncharacterized LabA/DUF88 family protein
MSKTIVYIDGFNLYYGALRNTNYKWLDLSRLCHLMLPKNQIIEIKYFTAKVKARPTDPDQPVRQQTYLRALRTIPNLSIIFGHFLSNEVTMHLAHPQPGGPTTARVIKTEEKGSDVNLATHLLMDGFHSKYEVAVLVTNDSDLLEPIKVVTQQLKRTVGILCPHQKPSQVLRHHTNFIKPIRKGVLAASQFPPTLTDAQGTFQKPAVW